LELFVLDTKLTCPDCGGVLGPAEPGVSPCTCFKSPSYSQASLSQDNLEQPGFEQPNSEASLSDTHPVETLSKVCFKCGADVAGKKRYKDSRGYMCADCNRAEIDAEKAGTAPCSSCGRRVKVAGLVDFHGDRICKLCLAEQRDADKKKIKLVSGKNYDTQDKRKLKILIIVMLILAAFILYSHFRR
jgi:DNA-directed RNA polymerase subunit RPC12/RpoP